MFSYLPCVVSYFGELISFSAESGSLDSEISQSLTSAKEKPLPSSKSGESVADVVKPLHPTLEARRASISVIMILC